MRHRAPRISRVLDAGDLVDLRARPRLHQLVDVRRNARALPSNVVMSRKMIPGLDNPECCGSQPAGRFQAPERSSSHFNPIGKRCQCDEPRQAGKQRQRRAPARRPRRAFSGARDRVPRAPCERRIERAVEPTGHGSCSCGKSRARRTTRRVAFSAFAVRPDDVLYGDGRHGPDASSRNLSPWRLSRSRSRLRGELRLRHVGHADHRITRVL